MRMADFTTPSRKITVANYENPVNGFYDMKNIKVETGKKRVNLLNGIIEFQDIGGLFLGNKSSSAFDGTFYNLILRDHAIIIGDIENRNDYLIQTIFVGNTTSFFKGKDDVHIDHKMNYDYIIMKLDLNTIIDHLKGYFNVIYYEENEYGIKNNKDIPEKIKEYLIKNL